MIFLAAFHYSHEARMGQYLAQARKADSMLREVLMRPDREDAAWWHRWLNHHKDGRLLLEFAAEPPQRHWRLAEDLSACGRLQSLVEAEGDATKTVRGVAREIERWRTKVLPLARATPVPSAPTLPSATEILAIEKIYEALVDTAFSSLEGTRSAGRLGELATRHRRNILKSRVNSVFIDIRLAAVAGQLKRSVFAEVAERLRAHADRDENDADDIDTISIRPLLDQVRRMSSVLETLFADSMTAPSFVDAAAHALTEIERDRQAGEHVRHHPRATFVWAWSIARLIEGWRPRALHARSKRPGQEVKVSRGAETYYGKLARTLYGALKSDNAIASTLTFSSTTKMAAETLRGFSAASPVPFAGRWKIRDEDEWDGQ